MARQIVRPDGVVLRGEEAGDGPTVVLLHAGGERRRVWSPVIEVLVAAGFRCVAYDQRGHGDSDGAARSLAVCAADVAAVLAAEPVGCVLVGASLGGLAAVAALADPAVRARVAGLVLVDVVPGLDPDRVRAFLGRTPGAERHSGLTEDILARGAELRRITGSLDCPILLVRAGGGGPLVDEDVADLTGLAPHATVTVIPDTGHLIAREQPVRLAEALTVTLDWPARGLLTDLDARRLDHPGGTLVEHLVRVGQVVADGSPRLRLAALCHAAYGTDGFAHPLLPLDRRDRLRAAIGTDAERLVYLYGACDRAATYARMDEVPLPVADRFTGAVTALAGADLADFATLTVANELDVARTASLEPGTRRQIRELVTALAPHCPALAATALADPALSDAPNGFDRAPTGRT